MKKTKFFTLALLSAAVIFTTSCSDDEDTVLAPSLSVTETHTNKTGGAVEIELGDQLEFAWESRKGDNNIKTFSLSMSGAYSTTQLTTYNNNELPYTVKSGDKSIYVDTISFPSAGINLGTTNYTFTSSDGTNSKSVSFNVTVVAAQGETTPLTNPEDFQWKRVAGSDAQGPEQFGLKYSSNDGGKAIVAVNGATMYQLASTSWTTLNTQEDLAAVMASSTEITKYTGVDVVQASKTYNDVLAVNYNNVNYLIHITKSTVEVSGAGSTVIIIGQYKK